MKCLRLNTDSRGNSWENSRERTDLVVNKNGTYHTTDFDLNNHYENGYIVFEKFEDDKVWSGGFLRCRTGNYYSL